MSLSVYNKIHLKQWNKKKEYLCPIKHGSNVYECVGMYDDTVKNTEKLRKTSYRFLLS